MRPEGCRVEPEYLNGSLIDEIPVKGTGNIDWRCVSLRIREDSIIINGTLIKSDPEYSRNVVVEKDGRVIPDTCLSWER